MIAALAVTVAAATIVGAIEWARMALHRARTRRAIARIEPCRCLTALDQATCVRPCQMAGVSWSTPSNRSPRP